MNPNKNFVERTVACGDHRHKVTSGIEGPEDDPRTVVRIDGEWAYQTEQGEIVSPLDAVISDWSWTDEDDQEHVVVIGDHNWHAWIFAEEHDQELSLVDIRTLYRSRLVTLQAEAGEYGDDDLVAAIDALLSEGNEPMPNSTDPTRGIGYSALAEEANTYINLVKMYLLAGIDGSSLIDDAAAMHDFLTRTSIGEAVFEDDDDHRAWIEKGRIEATGENIARAIAAERTKVIAAETRQAPSQCEVSWRDVVLEAAKMSAVGR
jgi:hypothetical protein